MPVPLGGSPQPKASPRSIRHACGRSVTVFRVRFAISIPQYAPGGQFDPGRFRSHLQRAEELGFESAWVQEQVLGSAGLLSPLETLTFAAACTERLRLGCAVFVLPLHNPLHLAKAIASLDCLSRGRLDVGVVSGGAGRPFAAFGVKPPRPVARFNEALSLMKACWREPRIDFDGEHWQLRGATMQPKPLQRPHPPLWLGGNHPNALARAVRLGDGFIGAGSQTTAAFAEQVRSIRRQLAIQDRAPDSFRIAKRVYIHVDGDEEAASRQLAAALERHYGRPGVEAVVVAGSPERCVAGLRDVLAAGAGMILLNPLLDDERQLERLAGEVLPPLRDSA
jgi:probable F420-dependent oxidoreductase